MAPDDVTFGVAHRPPLESTSGTDWSDPPSPIGGGGFYYSG